LADLYIRWTGADAGVRPITPCWPPNAVWTNVSIWMSYPSNYPDPARRGATAYAARLDEQLLINVNVYTKGASFPFPAFDETPIVCQVWACTGVNGVGPISSLPSTNGPAGLEGIVDGEVDPPDFYGIATVLWTPTAADNLSFDASGAAHVCLAANLVFSSPTGSTPHPQGQHLPQFVSGGQAVQTVFPCGDGPNDPRSLVPIGHFQGQKNIQVLDANAGGPIAMLVRPADERPGIHVLELSERGAAALRDQAVREQLLAHPAVDLVGGRPRRPRTRELTSRQLELLAVRLGEDVLADGSLPLEPVERARLARGGSLVLADDAEIRLEAALRPLREIALEGSAGRGRRLEIEADPDAPARVAVDLARSDDPPGTVRVFDLAERVRGGPLVGGTTFVTVALP